LVTFFSPIVFVLSFVLILVAAMTLPAMGLAMADGQTSLHAFLFTGGFCFLLGLMGYLATRGRKFTVLSKQLYLITVGSWFMLSLAGALPIHLALGVSFTDAFFESMSGVTTTGSTVLSGLDQMPHSVLLWRGELQWVGGIGIIVLGIAILPFLRIGGMRLFATESSDWSGKTMPRAQVLVRNIGTIYLLLSLLATLSYWLCGMNPFDAIVHAMTTMATGGYANYDSSMGHFADNPAILWFSSFFMLSASMPFMLYVALLQGNSRPLWMDSQVRGFLLFVLLIVAFLTMERVINGDISPFHAATQVTFNVVSIVTTTGYVAGDYSTWGSWAVVVFFYLMFVGGCSGSTAGSVKFFRYQVSLVLLWNQLKVMRHPSAVFVSKFNSRVVSDEIIRSIVAFSFFFVLTVALLTLALSLTGLDFVSSLSAAATAVTNVGPGLGEVVGPVANFESLTDTAKWLLSIGMLLGRLEIMTVIVLLTPTFWRS
jgi:trk system potassium uptake protein TrkH